jgi:hypothetical protein
MDFLLSSATQPHALRQYQLAKILTHELEAPLGDPATGIS